MSNLTKKSFDLDNFGQPILIASHPRSGTHLTIDFLRRQFPACKSWKYPGETSDHLYLALEGLTTSQDGISFQHGMKILKRASCPLIKTHAYPSLGHLTDHYNTLQNWIHQNARKIYVVRDGRSVLCSMHLYMQSFVPETRCSLSEFLRQRVDQTSRVKAWANHVQIWMNQSDIHLLKFEEIIQRPKQTLTTLSKVLGSTPTYCEPLLPKAHQNIWQGRWARLTQWCPESSAIIGYYRSQKTQKWQDGFTSNDRAFFHQEAGDVLIKLGYINSDVWIHDPVAKDT